MSTSVSGHLPEKRRHFVSSKTFCALELGLGLRLGLELAEIRLNTFSVKRPFGQVYL